MNSVTQVTMTALLTNIEGGHLTALEAKYRRSEKFHYKKISYSSYFNKIKTHEIFYNENYTFNIMYKAQTCTSLFYSY